MLSVGSKKVRRGEIDQELCRKSGRFFFFFFVFTLVTGPRRSLRLKLSDTRVYGPQIRARLGTTTYLCEVVVGSKKVRRGEIDQELCRRVADSGRKDNTALYSLLAEQRASGKVRCIFISAFLSLHFYSRESILAQRN